MNGDLRVAYRASREGPRDIVFVPNWLTYCEVLPELPSLQGWVEAMTSLGRLIFFDQPGIGSVRSRRSWRAADIGAMGRQHHRSSRRSRESRSGTPGERRRVDDSGAVRGNTSVPHNRAGRARGLRGSAGLSRRPLGSNTVLARDGRDVGHGSIQHVVNPDMPWNEEIRATWARQERLAASPGTFALMLPLVTEVDVRARASHNSRANACPPTHRLDVHAGVGQVRRRSHIRREVRRATWAQYLTTTSNRWRDSFQEIAEFLTGAAARRSRRSGSRHGAFHRHRGLDAPGCGDRRPRLACAARRARRRRPRTARPLPGPRGEHVG